MCGRYTLTDPDPRILRLRFDLSKKIKIEEQPRFNIAPTDPVLAIRRHDGERDLGRLRWGLVPPGATPKKIGRPLINARAETVERQPAFRGPFAAQRCLMPADGFYEWQRTEEGKQAVWVSLPDDELFSFAGLWAKSRDDEGAELHSCTLITTEPSEQMRPIHNRMPVILPREAEAQWLDPEAEIGDLRGLMRPREGLEIRAVSNAVNNVRDDGPHLIAPAPEGAEAQTEPRLF
jgi:putative SOS response-associated peptidase YedK